MARLAWLLGLGLLGCTSPEGPQGSWAISGHGISGGLVGDGDTLTVTMSGPAWTTETTGAEARFVLDADGSSWLYFPVATAAGEAEAALQLDLEAGTGRLPLGFRDGEHVFALTVTPGEPAAITPPPGLGDLQRAWQGEGFTLRDTAGALAGSLQLLPGDQARVLLLSSTAITDGAVPAMRKAEGPDLLLAFPVEPRFADELGLLRLNLPTMKAVLPVDRVPHPSDRWLTVNAGLPTDPQLSEREAQVRAEALQAEKALLSRLAQELSGAALAIREDKGRCPTVEELQPDWKLLLEDYRLRMSETAGDCVVHLEPHLVQHTRRTAIRATAQGLHQIEVLGGE